MLICFLPSVNFEIPGLVVFWQFCPVLLLLLVKRIYQASHQQFWKPFSSNDLLRLCPSQTTPKQEGFPEQIHIWSSGCTCWVGQGWNKFHWSIHLFNISSTFKGDSQRDWASCNQTEDEIGALEVCHSTWKWIGKLVWVESPHPFLEQSSGRKIEKGGECFPSLRLIVGNERMENHLWRKLPDEKHTP